jgi:hypothetical protein
MESHVAISIGTIIAGLGFFFAWHKDAKETAKLIQKLETEVEQLREQRQDIRDLKGEISDLKNDMTLMKQTLTRVDTNITHIMEDRR